MPPAAFVDPENVLAAGICAGCCMAAASAPPLRGEQGATAVFAAAPAGVIGLELFGVGLINDQAVVIVEFLARPDFAQCFDENPAIYLVGLAIGRARVVDPAGRVAAHFGVNHMLVIHMKIKGMVGVLGVMRMAALRLFPADHLADVLDDDLPPGNVLHGEHALAMNA